MRISPKKGFRIICSLLMLMLVFNISTITSMAKNEGEKSYNLHLNNYEAENCGGISHSYLYSEGEYLVRVEALDDSILVEKYTSDFSAIVYTKTIPFELPLWGGFYCGSNALFVMYGQENPQESSDIEVVRVVKYDMSWNRIGHVSFSGIGVYRPFALGGASFAEIGDILHIRTSRLKYEDNNGIHHQSNLYIALNSSTMTYYASGTVSSSLGTQEISYNPITGETTYSEQYPESFYVSHSFNQFICADGDKIVTVDHGDGYPRAVSMITKNRRAYLLTIPGEIGENYTGVYVGGLDFSDNNYLATISCIDYEYGEYWYDSIVHNVSLCVVPKNSSKSIYTVKLTNYSEDSDISCGNPYLVKISENKFVVLWNLYYFTDEDFIRSTENYYDVGYNYNKFQAVVVDENGKLLSDVQTFEGCLSDCKPIVINGTILWYTTGKKSNQPKAYDRRIETLPCLYKMETNKNNLSIETINNEPIEYIVNHYTQTNDSQIDNKREYALCESESYSIKQGSKVTPKVKNYQGFSSPSKKTVNITNEGMEIDYYYTANSYNLSWDLDGGTAENKYTSGKVTYRDSIIEPELRKDGFVFVGWDKTVPENMPAYDLKIKAIWEKENLYNSNEEQVKAFVTRFYTLILNRKPDETGINYWTQILLNKEQTGAQVAYGFVNSPEFTEEHPVNDTEFVKRMYAAFFDRDGGADGEAWWLGYLNKGYTRNYVLAGFTNSDEFKNLCAQYGIDQGSLPMDESMKTNPNPSPQPGPHVDGLNIDASNVDPAKLDEYIDRLYRLVLKREPEADGKQYWREEIIKGNPYNASTAAEIGFFNSPEYLAMNKTDEEFIMDCYLVFLNREAEASGFEYWKEKFRTGEYDRQKLIEVGVGHSNEFKDILRSYGFVIIE